MLFSVMIEVMNEISKAQLEIIERPFQKVSSKITGGLFKSYINLWPLNNDYGVYAFAQKDTHSVLSVIDNEAKEAPDAQLSKETTDGYFIGIAQRLGRQILYRCSQWALIANGSSDYQIIEQKQNSFCIDSSTEHHMPSGLLDAIYNHKESDMVPDSQTLFIPIIDTVQDLVDVFSKYREVDL